MTQRMFTAVGRLEEVRLRDVWDHEALSFTPWLLSNADALGEALGIELELRSAEHEVGEFSLDLIGRDVATGDRVIIENQLEPTDHSHLGQLLTYAGGTDPTIIVWLAAVFRQEHRQALDWLNQRTDEQTRFFGVEVTAVRIGDSPPAPLFRLVAQPNDWGKRVRTRAHAVTERSERAQLQAEFWSRFLERLHTSHPGWTRTKTPPAQNWLPMSAGVSGVSYSLSLGHDHLRSEIYFGSADEQLNTRWFQAMADQRAALEEAYGRPLVFELLPERKGCRIADRLDGSFDDTDRWEEYLSWFLDSHSRMRAALTRIGGVEMLRALAKRSAETGDRAGDPGV